MSARRRTRTARTTARVIWTDRALGDLEEVGEYIARHDPRAAARWVDRILATAQAAAGHPLACRRVPELAREDVREALLGAYRIVFRVEGAGIAVLTVFEGHRRFPQDVDVDR